MKIPNILTVLLISLVCMTSALAQSPVEELTRARDLKNAGVLMDAVETYESYISKVPNNSQARAELVELLLRLNQIPRAVQHIHILKDENFASPQMNSWNAIVEKYTKEVTASQIDDYEKKVADPNVSPAVILEFARFLVNHRMMDRAFEMFKLYISKQQDHAPRIQVQLEYAKQLTWNRRYAPARTELNAVLRQQPNNVEALVMYGNLLYWQGDDLQAVEYYRKAVSINPNHREANEQLKRISSTPGFREKELKAAVEQDPKGKPLTDLALFYFEEERYWEADSLIIVRLNIEPTDADAQLLRSKIEENRRKQQEEFVQQQMRILANNPKDSTALITLAQYYASVPDYKTSLEYYERLIRDYPNAYQLRIQRAKIRSWAGMNELAEEEFRYLNLVVPDNPEVQLALADALLISGSNLDEAQEIYKKHQVQQPDNVNILLGIAETYRRKGMYDEAKTYYQKVLEKDPQNKAAIDGLKYLESDVTPLILHFEEQLSQDISDKQRSDVEKKLVNLYIDVGRYQEALNTIQSYQIRNPNDRSLNSTQADLQNRKKLQEQQQLSKLRLSILENPFDSEIRLQYARLLHYVGELGEAIAQYRLLLNAPQGVAQIDEEKLLLEFAQVLLDAKRLQEASEVYLQLCDMRPNNFDYRNRSAQVLSWMGEYDRAIREYQRALQMQPESEDVYFGIANTYKWKGDPYSAYDIYNRVLAINPQHQGAKKALKEMQSIYLSGFIYSYRRTEDNEDFLLEEQHIGVSVNLGIKARGQIVTGKVFFEQPENKPSDMYAEHGQYIYANVDYHHDQFTVFTIQVRHNIYENRQSEGFYASLSKNFKDNPDWDGLTAIVSYSYQDAVYNLGSSSGLFVWREKLKTDLISLIATYDHTERYILGGDVRLLSISDGNSRTSLGTEGFYIYNELLRFGVRYDNISAKNEQEGYWTPDKYATLIGIVRLKGDTRNLFYQIEGGYGRVLTTNHPTQRFSIQVGSQISRRISVGGGFSALKTSRDDGEYVYNALSFYLTYSR